MQLEKNHREARRAIWHIATITMAVKAMNCFLESLVTMATTIVVALFFLSEILRFYNAPFRQFCNTHYPKLGLRPEELNHRISSIDCAAAILLGWIIFPIHVFNTSLMILALADPLARIFGMNWGKMKIPGDGNKTIIGSSTFLVTAFFSSLAFIPWHQAMVAAGVATLIEAYADNIPIIDDNFWVPIITGLVLIGCF